MLVSDKLNFKNIKGYKKQRRTLYINKSFNTARKYNNY